MLLNQNTKSTKASSKTLKLTFEYHLKMVTTKLNRTIGPLRKPQTLLQRTALITSYKAFVRPHLDYGDIVYDQAFNLSFH